MGLESDAIGGKERWWYTQLMEKKIKVGQGPAPTMESWLGCHSANCVGLNEFNGLGFDVKCIWVG